MDAVAALLDGPRARDAFVLRARMEPPWSLQVEDGAPLTVVATLAGEAWITADGRRPRRLGGGGVALARGPDRYWIADRPGRAPTALVLEGDRCMSLDGAPLEETWRHGIRTWGNCASGSTTLLIGTYHMHTEVTGRLLAALPPVLIVDASPRVGPLLALLDGEVSREDPGQSAVLDRLVDLLVVATLRSWFARPDGAAPGWYRALSDPVVGTALRLIHHRPAEPWTVAGLADAVGVSRATLARRFTELVAQSPMAYLTDWRMRMAADRLLEPDANVTTVAAEVGYATPFAFSAAFKRERGLSPTEHRRRHIPPPDDPAPDDRARYTSGIHRHEEASPWPTPASISTSPRR